MKKMVLVCLMIMAAVILFANGNKESGSSDRMVLQWCPMSTPVSDDGALVLLMEEKFNVDFEMWDKSEGAALNVRIAAGEIPDFFGAGNETYRTYVEDGVLAEVPMDMLKEDAPNLYNKYITDRPGDIEARIMDDKLWCLPNSDAETGGTRHMIAYRGDWMKAVGINKVPETLDEFEELVYSYTKNDPDGNGIDDTYGLSTSGLEVVFGAYGGVPLPQWNSAIWQERDGKVSYDSVQPKMKEALALLRQWYADGVIDPEFVMLDGKGENKGTSYSKFSFISGQVGVVTDNYLYLKNESMVDGDRIAKNIAEMDRLNPEAVKTLTYGKPPVGPYGDKGTWMNSPFHGWYLGFGKQLEKDPEKMSVILKINDYANATDEGFLLNRYGVLGEHWNWKDGVKDTLVMQKEDYLQWGQITEIGGGICFSSIWFPSIQKRVNNNLKWAMERHPELYEDGYLDAVYLPLPSAGKYQSELDKIRDEAYLEIITGVRPLDSFDSFVDEWFAAGGDILTKEANAKH